MFEYANPTAGSWNLIGAAFRYSVQAIAKIPIEFTYKFMVAFSGKEYLMDTPLLGMVMSVVVIYKYFQ